MTRLFTLFCLMGVCMPLVGADEATKKAEQKDDSLPLAVAIKGTPKIDGNIDKAWNKAPHIRVEKPVPTLQVTAEKEMAIAVVQLLWDKQHIYALWQVNDKQLSATAGDPWEQDSVELFLDENNRKTPFYQFDDAQYRVSCEGKLSGQGEGFVEENLKAAVKKTDDGYIVEMVVKVNDANKLKDGVTLGLELQLNDDPGSGARGSVAKWNHTEDDSWEDTSNFGTLKLK